MTYTYLSRPAENHQHDLPDCDVKNTVVRCDYCGTTFVLRAGAFEGLGDWKWVRLRWWHHRARRALRSGHGHLPEQGPPALREVASQINRSVARARSRAEHPAGRGYPAGGVVNPDHPMPVNFPAHPTLPTVGEADA